MPRSALSPCTQPGCTNLVPSGRCKLHGIYQKPGRDAKFYNTDTWVRMRKRVSREEPICRRCGRNPSEHVDHIVPISEGGARMDRANLQGLCPPCHGRKTHEDIHRRKKRP